MNYSARKEGNNDWARVSGFLKAQEKAQKQALKLQAKAQKTQRSTRKELTADEVMADYDKWLKVQEAQSFLDSRTPTNNSAESIMADYDNWLKAQEAPVQKAQDAPVQKAVQKEERQKQIPVLQDNRVFNEQDARKRQTEEVMKNRVFDEESAKKRQAEQEAAVKEADFKKAKKKYAADMSGVDKGQAVSQLASDLRQARTPEVNEAQALVDKENFTKDDKKRAEEILKKYDTETVRKDPSLSALRERMLSDNAALGATAGAVSQLGKRYYVGDKLAAKATGGKTLAEREAEANPVYRQNKIAAANAENNGDQALADAYMQAMQGLVDQNDIGKMDAAAARDNKYSYGAGKMAAQVGENIMLNGLLNNAGIAVNTGFTKLHKALDFLAKQGINSIPDILGDTIPTVAEAYDEGQRGNELALTAGANLGGNILLNAGTDIAPDVAKAVAERFLQADPKYLAGLRKYGDEVLHPLAEGADNAARNADIASLAKPVTQEIPNPLDPATMAKQAAEGVDDLAAQSKQAAETIENLSEQVPKQDIGHELAWRYADSAHNYDPYDYGDSMYSDSGMVEEAAIEEMARDINEGKDLSGYIEKLEEVVDEVEDPAERAEVENLIRELSELNPTKPAEAAQEVAEQVGSGRARIVDNALNGRKPSDTDSRVMGNMFAVIEQEVRDGKLNLSEDELTDILGAMNKYVRTGDKGALVPVDEILLKAGAEEVPLRTPRVGVDPMIAEPLDRFDIMANNIRDIIGRLDYSGNAKAEKEAGIIEQALQDYEKALNAKDAEAAKEASKTLTNARRRFHNAVEGLDGYNGELNTASMGKAIDTPRFQMAKRIGSGNSDFEIPDEPLEKRVAHPYGTTIEEHLERSKRLADRNDAAKTLTQEINKRIPDTQEATDKYVNFVNAVHNMALDDSPEAKKALQDAYDAITDVLTEPLPEEAVGDAARLLDMDLQYFAKDADDVAKAINPEDIAKTAGPIDNVPKAPEVDADLPGKTAISQSRTNTYERLGWGEHMPEEDYRYRVYGEEEQNADAIARYQNTQDVARTLIQKNPGEFDAPDIKAAFSEMQELLDSGDPEKIMLAQELSKRTSAAGTEGGRIGQAFAEYTRNTAAGALVDANRAQDDLVLRPWKSKNKKAVEGNKRIAQALADMGNKWKETGAKPALTHDEIKKGVIAELEKEAESIGKKFSDNDIEYLTRLAEDKSVPVWMITDEIEHFLNHGMFYTIDESTPIKVKKNKQLANMLDHIVGGKEVEKAAKSPESYSEFLGKIKNTLNDESIGVADQFNDADYYFIGKMFEDHVPKWQIEDELRHKLETGEWYTIDESTPVPKPINKKLQNAIEHLVNNQVRTETPMPTLSEITEQVRNTIDKEYASLAGDITDDDIDYLANLINNGATKQELADALDMRLATGSFGISPETLQQVNAIFKEISHFDPDSKQFVEGQAEAYKLLADAVLPKATPMEKFEAWRYIAMLGNPKTMLRNKIGNDTFAVVTGASNNLAAMIEAGTNAAVKFGKKVSNKVFNTSFDASRGIQRTKSVLNPISDNGLIKAAREYADASSYRQMTGTKYEKMSKDTLRQHKSVFDSKFAQLLEKATDAGISDYGAVKRKFSTSLAGYLKANGYDAEIFKAEDQLQRLKNLSENRLLTGPEKEQMESLTKDVEALRKAREYALKQADYATFHEDNKVAQLISEASRASNERGTGIGHVLIEGLLPFKKTPANVLRSGFEFSPLGAIDSIRKTGKLIYENTGKRAGNLADTYLNKKGKEVTKTLASDVIDSWSKTITGTGLAGLGYYLYNKGIIHSSEPDTKYQDQLEGHQDYAIEINGHSYTIDWSAPAIMPLMMGVELAKLWPTIGKGSEDFYDNINKYFDAATRFADPLVETSMLSSIQDTLESTANYVRNGEEKNIIPMLGFNLATGYATQAVPTLAGQIARTIDPTRRSTYTDKEGVAGVIDKQIKKQMNKLPFLSMLNPEYVDTYGRTQQNSPFNNPVGNLAYQMLSPGYYDKIDETDADRISREAYEATDGEKKQTLPEWKSSVKLDGKKADPETYTEYAKVYGEANKSIRDALAGSEWFNEQSPELKAEIVGEINALSNNIAKAKIDPEFTSESTLFKIYNEGGTEGLLDHFATKYNPYGIDKDAYKKMQEEGADMSKYEGYSEALSTREIEDKKAYRDAFASGGEEALDKEVAYQQALSDAGLSDSKTNRAAWEKLSKSDGDAVGTMTKLGEIRNGSKNEDGDVDIPSILDYANGNKDVTKDMLDMLKGADWTGSFRKSGDSWLYVKKDGNVVEGNNTPNGKARNELKSYGLKGDNFLPMLEKVKKEFPDMTSRRFAEIYKDIDRDYGQSNNSGVEQQEVVDFLNRESYNYDDGLKIWETFGKAWKTKPVYTTDKNGNGVWSMPKKSKKK